MKKTVLAAALLGLACAWASAQTAPGKSSEKVPAKHPKAASKKEEKKPVPVPVREVLQPFSMSSIDSGRVDPKFKGVPADRVVNALEAVSQLKKGEFETSADFEARKQNALAGKFIGNIGVGDLIPFVVSVTSKGPASNGFSYTYNADYKEASLYVLPEYRSFNGVGAPDYKYSSGSRPQLDTFRLDSDYNPRRTYEASNAYGAKVDVQELSGSQYGFSSPRIPFLVGNRHRYYDNTADPIAKLIIEAGEAAKELPSLKVLMVVRLAAPYMSYHFFHKKPTRTDPIEMTMTDKYLHGEVVRVVFFSGLDGTIFADLPAPVPNSETAAIAP